MQENLKNLKFQLRVGASAPPGQYGLTFFDSRANTHLPTEIFPFGHKKIRRPHLRSPMYGYFRLSNTRFIKRSYLAFVFAFLPQYSLDIFSFGSYSTVSS